MNLAGMPGGSEPVDVLAITITTAIDAVRREFEEFEAGKRRVKEAKRNKQQPVPGAPRPERALKGCLQTGSRSAREFFESAERPNQCALLGRTAHFRSKRRRGCTYDTWEPDHASEDDSRRAAYAG